MRAHSGAFKRAAGGLRPPGICMVTQHTKIQNFSMHVIKALCSVPIATVWGSAAVDVGELKSQESCGAMENQGAADKE